MHVYAYSVEPRSCPPCMGACELDASQHGTVEADRTYGGGMSAFNLVLAFGARLKPGISVTITAISGFQPPSRHSILRTPG